MRFEFATAARILFGPGTIREAAPAAAALGQRALLVHGSAADRAAAFRESLAAQGVQADLFQVSGEPTVEIAQQAVAKARAAGADLVIGLGGGSVIDTGKAVAALLTNPGEPLDYLEVIGRGEPLVQPSLPYIAIPTTAGTGAEVTRNAVLASGEHRVKVSLRSPSMLPRLAVVDPELTYSLPPEVTASTGLDALTQLIEPFVSVRANPLTDALCREGIARCARSLLRAYQDGQDASAREDMSLASLFGGLALANAALGAVHGFAGPIGGMFTAPHGAVCARLLPFVMDANLHALQSRQPQSPALERYREVACLLSGSPQAEPARGAARGAAEGSAWVQALCQSLSIPPLSAYGVSTGDIPALVESAVRASSMKGNPIQLLPEELADILNQAI